MEDRFLTLEQVKAISTDLERLKIGHVLAFQRVDPQWRSQYRAKRPELEGWMWSVRVSESLMPMPQIGSLMEVCQRHGLTFWMGGNSSNYDEGEQANASGGTLNPAVLTISTA